MIIYLHVAKTGGTTMLGYLMNHCKTFHVKSWWRADWKIPDDTECVFSHCPYGKPDKHFPGDHQYITFLRDPVERIVSYYYFVLRTQNHPEHIGFLKCSFKELIQSSTYATFDNGMVRVISGRYDMGTFPYKRRMTEVDLNRAKENLKTFAAIGMLDTFDEDLRRFANKFGWSDISYKRMRTGYHPRVEEIAPDVMEAIEERNKLDKELIDFARKIK